MKNQIKQILLAFFIVAGFTAQAQPLLVRMPDTTAAIGDFIDIPVYADSSLSGHNILSYQLKIYFNSTKLSFIGTEINGAISEFWGNPLSNSTGNYVYLAGAGSSYLSGTGSLLFLRFECINSGSTALNFDGSITYNYFNEGSPEMSFDNGYISIPALPTINIYPDAALIFVGEQKQFTANGGGTPPYNWTLTNPLVGSISDDGLFTSTSHGVTKVHVEDVNGVEDETTGLIEIRAMHLSIPDTSDWPGGNITIPIYASSFTGLNILSGNLRLSFTQSVLNPVGYSLEGTILEDYSTVEFSTMIPGKVDIAFASTEALSGNGVLLNIIFDVSSSSSGGTWIGFDEVLFNESLLAITENGYFSKNTFPNIYVSPNSGNLVAGETLQFSASGGVPPYSWATTNTNVASIDQSGLLTAHQSGVINVVATDEVGASGTSGNVQVYDTYVSIANGYAPFESVYDLPVTIEDLPAGQQVFSMQGSISFKVPELELLDIVTNGSMSSGWSVSKVIRNNSVNFAIAGTEAITEAGTLFYLRFQLSNELTINESAYVNFDNFILNEGVPFPELSNGSIKATEGIPALQELSFNSGWSAISSYVVPENKAIEILFEDAVPHIEILYNMDGDIYQPAYGVNTIGNWDTQEAYIIKTSNQTTATFDGLQNFNKTISIQQGWNLIPVISDCSVDVSVLSSGIAGFIMLKEVAGIGIYWPVMGINTIGNLQPGNAYFVNSSTSGSFTFPDCGL